MDEERKKLHDSLRDELLKRQLSNSENLDRSILMLSSAGLGLSLVFVKYPFPLSEAAWVLLLYSSWILFGSAILSTLVSFFVSQQGIKKQLKMNTEYYLEGQEQVKDQKNRWAKSTEWLSYVCASTYIFGVIFLCFFVARNLSKI